MIDLIRGFVLRVLYPSLIIFSPLLSNKKESLQLFIIKINNKLVRKEWSKKTFLYKKLKLLLLLPHCLQTQSCDIRITNNIYNCKRCGKCIINDIIGITQKYGLDLFIATGGTIARRIVKDVKPDAIVAVACERDLSSGIVDIYPIPVIGIANERPFGPCLNTTIDRKKIVEAIEFFEKISSTH